MSDGSITFSTRLDNSDLEKDLKKTEKDIDSLKRKLETAENEKSVIEEMMERGEQSIKRTESEVDALKAKIRELADVQPTDAGFGEAQMRSAELSSRLAETESQLAKQVKQQDALGDKWQQADAKAKVYGDRLASAQEKASGLGLKVKEQAEVSKEAWDASGTHIGKTFDNLGARIQKTMKKAFVITTIVQLVRSLKSNILDMAMKNEKFSAGVENLKAIFRGFISGIVQMVLPAMTAFVNMIGAMMQALAGLVDSVFHTGFTKAIQQQRDEAKAAVEKSNADKRAEYEAKAAKEAEKEAKSLKKLAKASKEASRQLMGFDELNVMAAESSRDAAEAYEPQAVEAPTYDTSWTDQMPGKIDAALSQIMLILGACLMAVGAVLCFSGINIPLGIALMVIGALMVYTAVTEAWDKLPAEVKEAINTFLVLAGLTLVVIGIVICLAAPQFLGIGLALIIAGLVTLYTACAVNWSGASKKTRETLTALMVIIGAFIIVVGVILVATGQIPLGIAAIVAGIAAIVAPIAMSWDKMPKKTQEFVAQLMTVIGGALLVIGVVLAVTGVGIPLAIGCILAGVGLIVSAAVLNWNNMPQKTRDFVSKMLAIVGGALIVVGIILCATGAGIPLGVACIVAGVASMVAAVALNWDFILDKVKELWKSLKSWWKNGPAKVFTLEWWKNLFKSIVNGLISIVNSAIGAFCDFVDWIGGGINSILAPFDKKVSIDAQSIKLPYLAEGAVIPPNRRFMAVLGDQRNGTNLEAPEDLIRQIVREESGAGGDVMGVLLDILEAVRGGSAVYVDRQVLGRVARAEIASMDRMSGR